MRRDSCIIKLICLLIVGMLLLSGCNDSGRDDEAQSGDFDVTYQENTPADEVKDMVLAEGGEAKYKIVYDIKSEDDVLIANYLKYKLREITGITFKTVNHTAEKTDNEILIGTALSRDETEGVYGEFSQRKECAVKFVGNKLCVVSSERAYKVVALMKLIESVKWNSESKTLTVRGNMDYLASSNKNAVEQLMKTAEYVDVYQDVFSTYSTYREQRYVMLSSENKNDQMLIEALIERMRNSAVFYEGSSSLLYNGYINKLDTEDYDRVAKAVNGELMIPKQFAEKYFGKTLSADADHYVNITELCKSESGYDLYNSEKLYVIVPDGVAAYSDLSQTVNGYTNADYVKRMKEFFTTDETPEPNNNTEQTKVVIATAEFPENIADWTEIVYDSLYTPCILSVKENGIDTIYLSYELQSVKGAFFSAGSGNPNTYVKKSTDGGKTWVDVCTISGMTYGQLMSVGDTIYVMGQNMKNIACIAKLNPQKSSGYEISFIHSNVSTTGGGPGTVVEKGGKIYRPYNASVYIADVTSDLMKSESWTLSESARTYFDNDWVLKVKGEVPSDWSIMEPNMVIGPQGQLYYMARVDGIGRNVAVMLELKDDGSFEYVGNNGIINIQTTWNRFCVRYDAESGKYITLTCVYTAKEHDRARRTLAIQVSDDMINWQVVDYVLVDREMVNPTYATWFHGFQYVDFDIEGGDIIMAVRESVGDANCYHDGTYITFYRMENFRNVISPNN